MKCYALRPLVIATLAVALTGAAFAQNNAECQRMRFSDEVLARFPRAPEACLDVITRDGQSYAVFKAQLVSVTGNTLRLRFKQPDGTYAAPTNVKTKPSRRVLIDGQPVPVSELAPNQELTAYVRVDKPLLALPPVNDSESLDPMPMAAPEPAVARADPVMPHTASPFELAALLGSLCCAVACALNLARRKDDDDRL
jgi:hypothetical protein